MNANQARPARHTHPPLRTRTLLGDRPQPLRLQSQVSDCWGPRLPTHQNESNWPFLTLCTFPPGFLLAETTAQAPARVLASLLVPPAPLLQLRTGWGQVMGAPPSHKLSFQGQSSNLLVSPSQIIIRRPFTNIFQKVFFSSHGKCLQTGPEPCVPGSE